MTAAVKSPLAQIHAPKIAVTMNATGPALAVPLFDQIVVPAKPVPKKPQQPAIAGQIVERMVEEQNMRRHKAGGSYYSPTNEQTIRAEAAEITAELRKQIPDWEITEKIEGPTHRPPFAVSWSFDRKGGK